MIPGAMGATTDQTYRDPELLAIGTFTICEKYGIDVPVVELDTYNIEAEALGQRLEFYKDIMPDIDRTRPLIKSKRDIVKITTPDFEKAGRCPLVVEMYRLFEKLTGVNSNIQFCAPFSLAANIRGISEIIMDIMIDPDFARDLFNSVTEDVLIPWLTFLKEAFPNTQTMVGADALASLPMINEDIMDRWVAPYIERLRDVVGLNVCVPNQTGERHSKTPEIVMDTRRRCNPYYVEGQDPDVEVLGPEFYKQYAQQNNLPLLLGVGAVFLNNSTPEEVFSRVKYYVQTGGKDGRFWLYLCNLSPTTPEKNIIAAIDAAHQYGTYQK
jgi:uroporphyrinogen-III decarboxylase